MLNDLKKSVYDGILAWNPDRLARNMKEGGEIIDMIDEGEIKEDLIGVKDGLTKLQSTLDGFVGVVDTLRAENEVGAHQIRELDVRVTKLESSKRPS